MAIYFKVSFIFILHVFVSVSASNVCEVTDTQRFSALQNPCIPIVNYRFLIPPAIIKNATALNVPNQYLLQLQAQKLLNLGSLKLFSASCQASYLSLVCSTIYQKCFVDQKNNSANFNPFRAVTKGKIATPVYQPCVSTCNAVSSTCGAVYKVLRGFPNCNTPMPVPPSLQVPPALQSLLPYVFDQTNNASTCFTPLKPSLAKSVEPYIFNTTGVCRGLTHTVYSAAGNLVNSSYAVLQAPYAMQIQLEKTLVQQAKNIPHWLTKKCQVSLRKYMCSSVYLYPQVSRISDLLALNNIPPAAIANIRKSNPALYNDSLTVPTYANKSICIDALQDCAFVLAHSTSGVVVNCSALVTGSTTLHRYSYKPQVLAKLPINPPTVVLSVYTYPNNMNDADLAESDTAVVCPGIFVIPDHPTNPHVTYVNNSDCAFPCVLFWEPSEWDSLGQSAQAICISGLILSLLMAVFLVFDSKNESQYLLIIYTILSGAVSLWSIVVNARPLNSRFCFDNAIQFKQDVGDSLCTAQAGIIQYTFIATAATFAMMYIVRVFNAFKFPLPKYVSVALIFAPPIIPVASAAYHNFLGFGGTLPVCAVLNRRYIPVTTEFLQLDLPVLIIGVTFGVFVLLNTITVDGYICVLLRHHYHFHFGGHHHSHALEIHPSKSGGGDATAVPDADAGGNVESGIELRQIEKSTTAGGDVAEEEEEEEETPEEKQKEDRYIDALLFVVPTVLIFGLYAAYRAEYYDSFHAIYDKTSDWAQCILRNSNENYDSICGNRPHPNKGLSIALTLIFTGNSIIVAPVYFVHMLLTKYFYSNETIDSSKEAPTDGDVAYEKVSAPDAAAESSPVDESSVAVVEVNLTVF